MWTRQVLKLRYATAFLIALDTRAIRDMVRSRSNGVGPTCVESEEEEFFECSSEELASEEVSRTQLKAKHLLWNKPAGRLAKHPSFRFDYLRE